MGLVEPCEDVSGGLIGLSIPLLRGMGVAWGPLSSWQGWKQIPGIRVLLDLCIKSLNEQW